VNSQPATAGLLALYDEALPQVYGYLLSRCGQKALAEDLTAETFLAAVDTVRRDQPVSIAWLIGVARHKLVDHWRRLAREERSLALVPTEPEPPWEDGVLDAVAARAVLERLGPQHRSALTLRYLDGLPVPEVARLLDRTLHATEALLVRARAAFRRAYDTPGTEVE
jgi:RNA polymerase sigma-70 factor (ECF subfamily)